MWYTPVYLSHKSKIKHICICTLLNLICYFMILGFMFCLIFWFACVVCEGVLFARINFFWKTGGSECKDVGDNH